MKGSEAKKEQEFQVILRFLGMKLSGDKNILSDAVQSLVDLIYFLTQFSSSVNKFNKLEQHEAPVTDM
jgi:hypothetical protein